MAQKHLDLIWGNTGFSKNKKIKNMKDNALDSDNLINTLDKIGKFKGESFVIKLPANIIEDENKLASFARDIALLKKLDTNIVVIHDHSNLVEDVLSTFGMKEMTIEGTRVADHKMVKLIEMVVSGHINKKIAAAISAAGVNAIGISGKDANLIKARNMKISKKRQDSNIQQIIDMGFVGEPVLINPEALVDFEDANIVAVLSPIAYGDNDQTFLLDVNLTAAIMSLAMAASHLFFLHPKAGIKSSKKMLDEISVEELRQIKRQQKFAREEMDIIEASISAIENHTENVHIIDSDVKNAILLDLFYDSRPGTLVKGDFEPNIIISD